MNKTQPRSKESIRTHTHPEATGWIVSFGRLFLVCNSRSRTEVFMGEFSLQTPSTTPGGQL